jgi:hypothetical protein
VLEKLGDVLHADAESGIDVTGNDSLPWNVKINVTAELMSDEQLAEIQETLGEDVAVFGLYDINFTNLLDGEEYEPDGTVTVRIRLTAQAMKIMQRWWSYISETTEHTNILKELWKTDISSLPRTAFRSMQLRVP